MITTNNSWAAIQARITEWQRQFRNSDYRPADFPLIGPEVPANRVGWFRVV